MCGTSCVNFLPRYRKIIAKAHAIQTFCRLWEAAELQFILAAEGSHFSTAVLSLLSFLLWISGIIFSLKLKNS
jgi:hypothetical protein